MSKTIIIILAFIILNIIPFESSWKADCVWCASQHGQPLFFEGHSIGVPFPWRTYGTEYYDYEETKFSEVNHPAFLFMNVLFLVVVCSGASLLSLRFRRSNKGEKHERTM